METLESYVVGGWKRGTGKAATLVDPTTEEPIAETSTEGVDFAATVAFAREKGGPALRAMTFAERGEVLRAMSRAIHGARDALIELAIKNGGNTRGDAKFDIDGASGTLAFYAELGKTLGATMHLVDGECVQLGRAPRFVGQHVSVPRAGIAVHVNAFNFPGWGLAEKAACALLAGVPVVTKPATSTALLAFAMMKLFVDGKMLPEGALQFVAGGVGDLLAHLGGHDALAFTGSHDTGAMLREKVLRANVRVNVEADSLNAAMLGPDAVAGSETHSLFLRDVVRDMTQKAGQKCTAIRRILVPASRLEEIETALVERLAEARVGDPALDGVSVGPVATAAQHRDVNAGIALLKAESRVAFGDAPLAKIGATGDKGYFVAPTLFVGSDASNAVHDHEVFGPVATILPYRDAGHAAALVARGQGCLVSSVYSDDRAFVGDVLFGIAPYNGRVMLGSEKIADQAPGPGTVLPQMIHGGPGRAGGGEELGGLRGLGFYSQRVAIQGSRPILEALLGTKS